MLCYDMKEIAIFYLTWRSKFFFEQFNSLYKKQYVAYVVPHATVPTFPTNKNITTYKDSYDISESCTYVRSKKLFVL